MNKKLRVAMMIGTPAVVIVFLAIPQGRKNIFDVINLLGSMDIESVKEYIRSFGVYSVTVSFLLMVFQSVIAPLPAFLITFSNAAVFGWIGGALLSWSSAMAGAALCYGIARLYGRNIVVKLTGKTSLISIDRFFEKFGTHAILIERLLPFMPFDIVSYGAGLTSVGFWQFFVATGIGQLPATIIYSYTGEMLGSGAKKFVFGLLIVFALVSLTVLLRSAFKERFGFSLKTKEPAEPERTGRE